MSRRLRGCLSVLLVLTVLTVALGAAAIWWFDWNNHKKPTLIDTAVSPDEAYTLKLEQIGNPSFFGPATAHVTLWETAGSRPLHTYSTSVYNDGAGLHLGSWEVVWEETRVTVTLKGCEQEDRPYTFDLADYS